MGGMCGTKHLKGGMHGRRACVAEVVHGGGCVAEGACMARCGMHGKGGWHAFLLLIILNVYQQKCVLQIKHITISVIK